MKRFIRSSSIVKSKQYPVDLKTYKKIIEKQFKDLGYNIKITDDIIEKKYKKACHIYDTLLTNPEMSDYKFKNPEDVFQQNWNV